MPVNEKVAMAAAISPLGPPVIVVSGGVLSTMTTRVAVRGLPARSVALAPSVWLPSATVEVSQVVAIESGEAGGAGVRVATDRKSTRLNSSHGYISYAVFCLKKKKNK